MSRRINYTAKRIRSGESPNPLFFSSAKKTGRTGEMWYNSIGSGRAKSVFAGSVIVFRKMEDSTKMAPKVKHQVFVSSTYEDLREERQEVMHALLELDCIPSGMELFPAANEDQWTLIQSVIDECDYYILILGGRYGSVGADGVGYTEMEYRYALERNKPILSFLHKTPGKLPGDKIESTDAGKKKFRAFRELARKKLCKTWTTPQDLGGVVSRGLVQLQRRHPAVGWVRGDLVPDQAAAQEILSLRKENDLLREQLQSVRMTPPLESDGLVQGEEVIHVGFTYVTRPEGNHSDFLASSILSDIYNPSKTMHAAIDVSWNEIFYHVSPNMINETPDPDFHGSLNDLIRQKAWKSASEKHSKDKKMSISDFSVNDGDFQTIKVQLRALGLIQQSRKPRTVKDTATYWTLTPYGDHVMTQLRAIRRK